MMQIDADFEQTVQFLYTQLPMFQRDGASAYKKDLTNTIQLCKALNHPEHQFKSIHVAGTNGKGSSSHYLAGILQTAGYKTGLYTSPHLKSFTERIKINGQEIPKSQVVDFVKRIKPLIEEIKPSFFEITVAMCFDYFAKEQVDIAVIEVGMGGRLDSTNVILPEVSLITNIGYDHQQWLGATLPKIAREKAGIIKDNVPVVISEMQPDISEVFISIAAEKAAELVFATDDCKQNDNEIECDPYKLVLPNKLPSYQLKNIPGVLKTISVLSERGFDIDNEHVQIGLKCAFELTGLKGRWQKLNDNPLVYCDVGHNEAGVRLILEQIAQLVFNKLYLVWGTVNDKDVTEILKLLPNTAQCIFCQASIPRAMSAVELQLQARELGLHGEVCEDVNEAIEKAKQMAGENDLIVIGGSNFVVAEIDNL